MSHRLLFQMSIMQQTAEMEAKEKLREAAEKKETADKKKPKKAKKSKLESKETPALKTLKCSLNSLALPVSCVEQDCSRLALMTSNLFSSYFLGFAPSLAVPMAKSIRGT